MDYDIREAFEAIENELIESMMRNFSRHRAEENAEGYLWSQWQAEQLKSLEKYRKTNATKFNKQFSTINAKVAEMLRIAREDGNADQEIAILEAIQNGFKVPDLVPDSMTGEFFKLNDRKLDALIKATTDDLEKAETAILRRANDQYRSAIFNAQVYANTGAGTYAKAVDMACRDMLRAGLSCVEYKNGAIHTLSDYAEMALRTANKRAYLYGEGEKRKEWGLSLVVVNSRKGGCSHCAEYIGKVFIDDVYSGGEKSDGDYPLLSDAIKGGLFHPRCKDSTSTYYEGITTLKLVSKEEMAEMDRRRELEAQKNYYDNQAGKNQRIADHSLDKDNQRAYQSRADVCKKKADEIGEKIAESLAKSDGSGIINAGGRSGAYNDKNDPYGEKRSKSAERYYSQILNRDRTYEIEAVARNTEFSIEEIDKVFAHVFELEHLFADGSIKRFNPDYYMQHSWMRLRSGRNIQKHDITLIRHELAESELMGIGTDVIYETAHEEVEKTFNYNKELLEYLKNHDA